MKLVIGNKNYSSWSLRSWLLMRESGIPFEEVRISLNDPSFKARALAYSPAGQVPVLLDGELRVWDSLAIAEYLAERFPEKRLWPESAPARAEARSLCAEMHAGFPALRREMPMNIEAQLPGRGWNLQVQRDIDRILEAWHRARLDHGQAGQFLFGAFSAADAFYAPVVWRFLAYGVEVPEAARHYMAAIQSLPSMQAWAAAAREERDFVAVDEPYRSIPAD